MSDQRRSYLAECYWPGVSVEKVVSAMGQIQQVTDDLRKRGDELQFIGSILVPVDETVFCLFDGTEAGVRSVSDSTGVPFERILESLRIGGN